MLRFIVSHAEELLSALFFRVSSLFTVVSVDHGMLTPCRPWDATIVWTSLYSVDYLVRLCVCWQAKRHIPRSLLRLCSIQVFKYLPKYCLLSAGRATTSTYNRETQPLSTVRGYLQYP